MERPNLFLAVGGIASSELQIEILTRIGKVHQQKSCSWICFRFEIARVRSGSKMY